MFSSETLGFVSVLFSAKKRVDDALNMPVVTRVNKAQFPWEPVAYNSDWPGLPPRKALPEILHRYVITLRDLLIKASVTDYASSQEARFDQEVSRHYQRLAGEGSRCLWLTAMVVRVR